MNLLRDHYRNIKRVIFNGNGYTDEWIEEAEKRGLFDQPEKLVPDAFPQCGLPRKYRTV